MKSIDDEGSELQFQVRLETGDSIRSRIGDLISWCNILLRLAIFMAIAGVIITIGLMNNGLDWLHVKVESKINGFH